MSKTEGVESKVREIRRKTRRTYSAEEKIRIVLEGMRGEESISALCRREWQTVIRMSISAQPAAWT